jgi:predicted transcriptional regulator of viral defense system
MTPDVLVADLAARQHRVAARRQLHRCGLGRGGIQRRVESKRLYPIHEDVFAVGPGDLTRPGFLIAAVLACGRGAVLSHRTAADHWGLIRTASPAIHVTVPRTKKPEVDGVTVHLTRQMTSADWTKRDGIPVTSVARTLIDLAAVVKPRELVKALEQAQRLRLFDLRAVQELLQRSRGRLGAKALRAGLAELNHEPPDTRSPLEDEFVDFCEQRHILPPQLNVVIADFCVDAAWPDKKVVVELDSRTHHTGIHAFEEDRKRDAKLQVAGHRIVRVTRHRLRHEADDLEVDLRRLLGAGAE